MSQSTIFQSCRDGATASWVIPVLSGSKVSCSRTQHGGQEVRGSSNKEWDFFYGAVNLHARLMKYHTYLVCPFGSSRATFMS